MIIEDIIKYTLLIRKVFAMHRADSQYSQAVLESPTMPETAPSRNPVLDDSHRTICCCELGGG